MSSDGPAPSRAPVFSVDPLEPLSPKPIDAELVVAELVLEEPEPAAAPIDGLTWSTLPRPIRIAAWAVIVMMIFHLLLMWRMQVRDMKDYGASFRGGTILLLLAGILKGYQPLWGVVQKLHVPVAIMMMPAMSLVAPALRVPANSALPRSLGALFDLTGIVYAVAAAVVGWALADAEAQYYFGVAKRPRRNALPPATVPHPLAAQAATRPGRQGVMPAAVRLAITVVVGMLVWHFALTQVVAERGLYDRVAVVRGAVLIAVFIGLLRGARPLWGLIHHNTVFAAPLFAMLAVYSAATELESAVVPVSHQWAHVFVIAGVTYACAAIALRVLLDRPSARRYFHVLCPQCESDDIRNASGLYDVCHCQHCDLKW